MRIDLEGRATQQEFGAIVGISQPTVSDLLKRRVLREGAPLREWLRAYCARLRDVAAGRGGDDSLELAAERARLAREQADKIAMQNAAMRAELAPTALLEDLLSQAGARASSILSAIPEDIRREFPQLSSADVGAVSRIVGKARRIAEGMSFATLTADEDEAGGEAGDAMEAAP